MGNFKKNVFSNKLMKKYKDMVFCADNTQIKYHRRSIRLKGYDYLSQGHILSPYARITRHIFLVM